MTRILVTNTAPGYNRGSMGRAIGLIECIQKSMPDAHITFWHRFYHKERDLFHNQIARANPRIALKEHPWYIETRSRPLTAINTVFRGGFSLVGSTINRVLRRLGLPLENKYQSYDVVVDPNYVESDQGISAAIGLFLNLINTLDCIVSGKPVLICAATVPPLKSRLIRLLTRLILNRVAVITLRENMSRENLQVLGINRPQIVTTGDLAFLLQPASNERLNSILKGESLTRPDGPIAVIAPASEIHFAEPEEYATFMASLSDFIIEELKATVVLVPNTSYDAPLVSMVQQKIKDGNKVLAFKDLYMADEIKAIIGMGDIFITPRFHALLAALSLAIPSIGIVTYNRTKFHGIAGELMGQEQYLIDVGSFDCDSLLNVVKPRIKLLWLNRDSIAMELRQRADPARQNTLLNGELIKKLADASKTRA